MIAVSGLAKLAVLLLASGAVLALLREKRWAVRLVVGAIACGILALTLSVEADVRYRACQRHQPKYPLGYAFG